MNKNGFEIWNLRYFLVPVNGELFCMQKAASRSLAAFAGYLYNVLIAASTTCPTRTDVVTLPTPPGTGVIASTIGSTAA